MKFLRSLFAGLLTTTGAVAAQPAASKSGADVMREMRTGWLTRIPEKGSYKSPDEVVAVLMDWPLGEQTATVLSTSAGDASLYTTSTFGIIGGIGHEKVRKAATAFVDCAQRFLKLSTATKKFPYPDSETLRFYLVTPSGVRTVSFPLKDFERIESHAREMFGYGQGVLTELRQITPNQKS